jgi:hypothetical protein
MRTVTFTVEDALISPISFAMLTGAGLANFTDADKQNKINIHTTFDLPILAGGEVHIDHSTAQGGISTADDRFNIVISEDVPMYGFVLDNTGAGVVPVGPITSASGPNPVDGVYTITENDDLIIQNDTLAEYVGKTVRLDCYAQHTGGATEMTIDAENFAGNYYVEASTLFRDQYTAQDMPAEIVLPNVKIQSNFTFSMANTGDPSTFTFTMDAFPDYTNFDKTHKVFAAIQIIGEENIAPTVIAADGEVEETD